MRTLCGTILAAATLSACPTAEAHSAPQPEKGGPAAAMAGPRANPEDQFRLFTLFPSIHYSDLAAMGINSFYSMQMFPALDGKTVEERRATLKAILDRIQADGNDYMTRFFDCSSDKELRKKYPRIGKDGKPYAKCYNLDVSNPEVRAELRMRAKKTLELTGHHPCIIGSQVTSEVRDTTRFSFTPYTSNAWAKASGGRPIPEEVTGERVGPHFRTIKDFPKGRVVPDDYPLLEFYRWFWREGDGWVNYYNDMVDEAQAYYGANALTYYEPAVRCPPLWRADSGKVSMEGQWLPANTLPYAVNYVVSEQQEMRKGHPGALLVTHVQGICNRSGTAPKGKKVANEPAWVRERPNTVYITVPPDMAVEEAWWIFARKVDGIGLYGWRALFDASMVIPADAANYQYTNHDTFPRLAELYRNVAVPLGPLFRAIPEREPEVAILESSAATFLAKRGSWGRDGFIWMTGMTATRANLMPHSLYDDDIKANGGIPDTVQVLLMPHCDVLTETTFHAVKRFQRRGGIVIGDKVLVPGIMPDAYIGGFPYYGGSAEAVAKGVAKAADDLVKAITPRYRRYATADEPDILLHVRTSGSADYVFAINDKRGAGDYIGQYELCLEKGLPNKGTVTVNRPAGAVYDLVAHRAVPFKCDGRRTEIPVKFNTSDGRVMLVVNAPLAPLSVCRNDGGVVVTTPDREVMIPIALEAPGAKPYYGVVKNGFWRKDGVPANATVRSLADGSVARPLAFSRPDEIVSRYREWKTAQIDPIVPASRPVVKVHKKPISQDPTFDHDIIPVKSIKIEGAAFGLPPKGKSAVVEAWLGVPDRDFTLKVNGHEAGYYETILNPQDEQVRFDLTPFIKWGGANEFEFLDTNGRKWLPKGTFEVLELGN